MHFTSILPNGIGQSTDSHEATHNGGHGGDHFHHARSSMVDTHWGLTEVIRFT